MGSRQGQLEEHAKWTNLREIHLPEERLETGIRAKAVVDGIHFQI
jgi:hypothetical protein